MKFPHLKKTFTSFIFSYKAINCFATSVNTEQPQSSSYGSAITPTITSSWPNTFYSMSISCWLATALCTLSAKQMVFQSISYFAIPISLSAKIVNGSQSCSCGGCTRIKIEVKYLERACMSFSCMAICTRSMSLSECQFLISRSLVLMRFLNCKFCYQLIAKLSRFSRSQTSIQS